MADTSSHTSNHEGPGVAPGLISSPSQSVTGQSLVEAIPDRVLAVYAHPDDPEISCGGTLARWAAGGGDVHVLVCARGEKGYAAGESTPDEVAARRAQEMEESGRVLGLAGRRQLAIDDGELVNDSALRRELVVAIREVRPDVILCPDPTAVFFGDTYFNHADHRVVGWATLDAVSPASSNPRYFPTAGTAHRVSTVLLSGTLDPNIWVDVGATLQTKVDAVLCHASQFSDGDEWFRDVLVQRAADGGRIAGVDYAEGFRRLALG